ncbi:hypothetical protein VB776_03100 [Arcicella sp. DC2W]|uniref:Outer membrane protein beta-barrel domain-containing protein n=1 Tax=Arcicella gelida TaxID=2984195 RepID=A0ABU5S0A7_9BACT|nr:hypothetical protein [Arcicella sp. DC2W]MEA5401888.1 hypothetical protein [Arcicella sp. DC2W]
MNALDNEKDPFEDIFRDKLFDFESEPNDKLWKSIEPQLPANPARRLPYWQMAAVAVLLLLTGMGVYLMPSSISNETGKAQVEKTQEKELNKVTTSENSLGKNNENSDKENKSTIIEENHLQKSDKVVSSTIESNGTSEKVQYELSSESKKTTLKEQQNRLKAVGVIPPVNLSNEVQHELAGDAKQNNFVNQYSKKYSLNKSSNKANRSAVFSGKYEDIDDESVSNSKVQENKFSEQRSTLLTSLDAKAYHPFTNHFRTPKIRYRGPKPTVYFKESKPVEWYVSAMPLINYYTITANGNDANYVHKIAVNDEADRLGFYTQAGLVFTLSDRFKLRTGLTFTKTNHSFSYQVRTDSLVVQSPDNTGVDVSFAELKKVYAQSAYYLGTKVDLQYTFLRGESLSHYVNVGVEGAYKINGSNQLNAFANIAYGITRQIGDYAYLFVEPTFSYSLNEQSDSNSLLLIKPNKIGFNIGINFKLK